MNRAPNSATHPKGWKFAGAARGFSFWKNGTQFRITPAHAPADAIATEKSLGLCIARAAVLSICAQLPIVEVAK